MRTYAAEAKMSSASEEEDYYFLQPMFEKHPPNELLSPKHAPDVATQVKLMYLPTHAALPRTNAGIMCTTTHPSLKAQNCSLTLLFSASSIPWAGSTPIR